MAALLGEGEPTFGARSHLGARYGAPPRAELVQVGQRGPHPGRARWQLEPGANPLHPRVPGEMDAEIGKLVEPAEGILGPIVVR
jgi:hypothetical protein